MTSPDVPQRPTVAFERRMREHEAAAAEKAKEHDAAAARLRRASQECRRSTDTGKTRLAIGVPKIDEPVKGEAS